MDKKNNVGIALDRAMKTTKENKRLDAKKNRTYIGRTGGKGSSKLARDVVDGNMSTKTT